MARTVQFGAREGARDALIDEREVMKVFHRHVKHCDTCYTSLQSGKTTDSYCTKGQGYITDMRPYFYCKKGKPYSWVDRKRSNEETRVLVSSDYKYVSMLFESLAGPTTPRREKPTVHQPASVRHEESRRPALIIPAEPSYTQSARTPRSGERYDERKYREPKYRGSLYRDDERRRTHQDAEVIYASPRRYNL